MSEEQTTEVAEQTNTESATEVFYGKEETKEQSTESESEKTDESVDDGILDSMEDKSDSSESADENSDEGDEASEESDQSSDDDGGEYELELSEDSLMTEDHYDDFVKFAEEQGLSKEQAQGLLERENAAIESYVSQKALKDEQMVNSWKQEAYNDPEIGGDKLAESAEYARRAINSFGGQEADIIKEGLKASGLGNSPAVLKLFSRIGKAMADDSLIEGGKTGTKSGDRTNEFVNAFYPNK